LRVMNGEHFRVLFASREPVRALEGRMSALEARLGLGMNYRN